MASRKRSDQKSFLGIKANPTVFIGSLSIVSIAVITTIVIGEPAKEWFTSTQSWVADSVGWVFIAVVNLTLFFALFLGFGKFGKIRIGGVTAKPEFTYGGWFSMLFSAGMGIGLLFWSVAEPVFHFSENPFLIDATDPLEEARTAMSVTFLHWGFHAWGLYAVVGAALAYFTFNRKLPLTIRSIFHPLFGNKIYGPLGDAIDILAVVATIFGLATSLGLGVQQVNAELEYLFGVENSVTVQVILIIVITFFATLSLLLGLDKGIRVLSEWNMRLAMLLLLFVIVIGPTIFIFKSFFSNIGDYLNRFFELSLSTNAYHENSDWQASWTIFYWAWWIAWSPFVGLFIARISKGRTLREFILSVLLVPTTITFLWLTAFGGSAIYQELIGNTAINEAVNENIATALYYLLEQYPMASVSSFLTVILVTSFFITSSDSGSYVVDTLTSGGRHDAPKGQKIFWASMEGLIAAALLIGGGLTALQTASILTGLPFALVIVVMCYSFYKALKEDTDL
ncbi:MAG: BCCT family transporter [Flavobacteriaceae bacterium]